MISSGNIYSSEKKLKNGYFIKYIFIAGLEGAFA